MLEIILKDSSQYLERQANYGKRNYNISEHIRREKVQNALY
jgi:hypothetical protein